MRTSKTFSVHFWLKKKSVRKNGTVPIYARITVDGVRADVSMKRATAIDNWCTQAGRINSRMSAAKPINDYLDGAYSDLVDCHKQLALEHKLITAQAIKKRFLREDEKSKTLKDVLKHHREKEAIKLAKGTAKNYKATEKYLLSYLLKRYKSSDIFLIQVDYSFVVNFEHHLRTAKPLLKSRPLTNNGIMKHMERFHKMINIALKFGWLEKDPFALYQLSFVAFDRPFLTMDELLSIEVLDLAEEGHRRVRDIFVFACYSGLSYIDAKELKRNNIALGIDGNEWISIRRVKSKTQVRVPLLEKAKIILDRYSNVRYKHNPNCLLPVYSNQKTNQYLKLIAGLCKIEKNLSFHVARHTFATSVTLSNGVPIETVSKLLGHKKLSTTQIYARVMEQKVSEDMAVLREKLQIQEKRLTEAI